MIPIILSGGSGTRMWPLSRADNPKQFSKLLELTLFASTYNRLRSFESPWVLTVEALKLQTEKELVALGAISPSIVFEPCMRNTGPALALLVHTLLQRGRGDEIVGIFPSDHLILNEKGFHQAIETCIEAAKTGKIVTLGIKPTRPATGFGYIEATAESLNGSAVPVMSFREKPDLQTASDFLKTGRFFWNAGIFIFRASDLAAAFQAHAPSLWNEILRITPDFSNAAQVYAEIDPVSFDVAIMEKIRNQVCVPCDIGWQDLGSWDDVAQLHNSENATAVASQASLVEVASSNCFTFSTTKKVIALLGVEDLLVIDTADALFISKAGESQKVREVVKQVGELFPSSL